ncbi:peptidylprolyl isomerase [Pseudoalteromonas fenneropenaei]|uniref:Peptidyl-prolyl cis-trans isomerase n=1 Tax=Pseudoalteromonas fenneropenaei TaxID=1737459 RepID=A0ABV7CH51_9GAMM
MKIAQNSVVKLHYAVLDNDQNTIDNTFDDEPMEVIIGSGYLIPGLEEALIGKQAGDTLSVNVPPEKGYGERFDDLTQAVPKSMFEGMDIEVGMQFRATTDEGDQLVVIIGIEEEDVIVDANHPLSGIALNFDVEVLDVREATAEELAHGHVHGQGGCGHDHDHDHDHQHGDGCCDHDHH